jgi:hypothetical protein
LRTIPVRRIARPPTVKRLLGTHSPEFTTAAQVALAGTNTSAPWFAANKPIAVPFVLAMPVTVLEFGWVNGSGTMTDSFDIGIYSTSWTRLISTGGTTRSGVSVAQWVNVTDTVILPGRYYLVMSGNGITANQLQGFSTVGANVWAQVGCLDSTTDAYPLPDPLTNMGVMATNTRMPICAIVTIPRFT